MPLTDAEWRDADIAARKADLEFRERDLAFRKLQQQSWEAVNTASTAAQNARAQAEDRVATAGIAAAEAQKVAAAALNMPLPAPSDAQLLLGFIEKLLAAGKFGVSVIDEAKFQLKQYKAATTKPPSAPL